MKKLLISRFGGPEVLEVVDAPSPAVGDHDVLVRVRAASLNHLDLWVRKGTANPTLPHTPGSEAAGTVLAAGDHVKDFKAGQEVIVLPGLYCGKCAQCRRGFENYCANFKVRGAGTQGCQSEEVSIPSKYLIPKPSFFSFAEAAAFPLVTMTAWHLLMTRAALQAGETVLIHSPGSGVGSVAIQIALAVGAKVFTVTGSPSKVDKAKTLHPHDIFVSQEGKFADQVLTATGGKGANVILDHTGAVSWEENLKGLARGGRLGFCGTTTGSDVKVNLRDIFSRQITLMGTYMGSYFELEQALRLAELGKLRPVIDSEFPFTEAAAAHKRMEDREVFGKIVLTFP